MYIYLFWTNILRIMRRFAVAENKVTKPKVAGARSNFFYSDSRQRRE